MEHRIARVAVIRGDGIGPEIMEEGLRVLDAVEQRFGRSFAISEALMGGAAIDAEGTPLPEETLRVCLGSDAVLLGAVGGPKWDHLPVAQRPEIGGLLPLRKQMGLYANLRPVRLYPALAAASPLRNSAGIDLMVVRELTGGIYFGEHRTEQRPGPDGMPRWFARDVMQYEEDEILRILHCAFQTARTRAMGRTRAPKVTSVDKANVLDTSRLWRTLAEGVAAEYPDVAFEHMLVDNAAMQLVRNPAQFDVLVTENMFGDILSDEASMLTGSIGMLPSASLGTGGPGLFEPIHGSAPDIAGQDKANPLAMILSVAMMLRDGLGMAKKAAAVEAAVQQALAEGLRTADMMDEESARQGCRLVGCREMGGCVSTSTAAQP